MALGIEQNNIAPQLIQNSGQALVQGIRQIGQQISGHLTEMQTKRDLASLAQEMQGMNPQSAEFPVQLVQVASRHPMAVRDERGQMAMSILGKAHGAWQASQADTLAFQRQMQMQGLRDAAATKRAEAAETARASRPVSVFGVGLVDPVSGETLVPEGSRGGSSGPKTLSPGSILVDPTGKKIAENPKAATASASEERLRRKDRIAAINQEINQFDSDIASAVKQYEASFKREMEAKPGSPEALRHQKDKTEIGKIADSLKAEKKKRLDILAKIRDEDQLPLEPELGVVPPGAVAPARVLPEPTALPPQGNPNELVPVINPSGKPTNLKRSQVEAALQYGYKLR